METFYHYTTLEFAKAILSDGVINMSTDARDRPDDVRYGNGVYLTRIPPTTAKYWIAFNNYDGMTPAIIERMIAKGKVDAYIKLKLDPDDVVECTDEQHGRDIFLYPEQDLVIEPYMKAELGVTD